MFFCRVGEGYGQFTPGAMVIICSSFSESSAEPKVPVPEPQVPVPPAEVLTAERLTGVGRDYVLYAGLLSAVTSFHVNLWDSPNIWWPEDRKWCIATDIDLDSTYVGGSEACIESLVNDIRFEVLPTTLDTPVYMEADTLNAGEVKG